ncbi:MAG: DUF1344 domain-containing protein [Pseudomonadota bacterium]
MKYILAPLSAVALLCAVSLAQAEEAKGTIAALDTSQGMIVLDSGETFTLADGVSVEGLTPGTEVTVSYEEKDGQKVVHDVLPSQ